MPSCERCWKDSGGRPSVYRRLLLQWDCTPEEQAGEAATICKRCGRKTVHQHSKFCVNPDCPSLTKEKGGKDDADGA